MSCLENGVKGEGLTGKTPPLYDLCENRFNPLDLKDKPYKNIFELLLKHKVNLNVLNYEGYSILHNCVRKDPESDGPDDYMDPSHKYILGELLKHGADPNIKDNYGETPLSVAVKLRKVEEVRLLLKHGANPNVAKWVEDYDDEKHTEYPVSLLTWAKRVEKLAEEHRNEETYLDRDARKEIIALLKAYGAREQSSIMESL
jgi:ankyrin repeat protein